MGESLAVQILFWKGDLVLGAAFENLDGPLDGAKLAVGEPLEPHCEAGAGGHAFLQLLAARFGQAQCKPTAIGGIVGALDVTRLDQALDGAADRRSAAADARGDVIQRGRLGGADCVEELAAAPLGALRRSIRNPVLGDGDEAAGKRLWS